MTHSPGQIVRQLLIDLGLASEPTQTGGGAWPAYAGSEPDTPDECVTCYTTFGQDNGRTWVGGKVYHYPGFQVRVRGRLNDPAWQKASAIRDAFQPVAFRTVAIGASRYTVQCVTRIGQVIDAGYDPVSKRKVFTLNAMLTVIQAA